MLSISIAGTSIAVFSILLILMKKQKQFSDAFLCIWLVLLTLPFLQSIIMSSFDPSPAVRKLFNPILTLIHGPALYIYIILLLNKKGAVKPWLAFHFLPVLTVYTLFQLSGAVFPMEPGEPGVIEPIHDLLNAPMRIRIAVGFAKNFGLINLIYFTVYSIVSLLQLRKHGKEIGSYYAQKDISITLKWVYVFPTLFIGFPLLIALNNVLHLFAHYQGIIHMLPFLIFVTALAVFGVKQKSLQYREDKSNPDNTSSLIETKEMDQIIRRMEIYMQEQQPYLDSSFSVEELAEHLQIPRRTLSLVLNTGLSKNFFRYTNEYRIENAKQLLTENPDGKINVLQIAFESGFNSKSSFNSLFKQYCGQTPSEYRKNALLNLKNAV